MRIVTIVLAALILCACAPVAGDPYAMIGQAAALDAAGRDALAATQAAQFERAQACTLQAGQATGTSEAHQQNVTATADYLSLQATGTAYRISALETQKAATVQAANTSEAYHLAAVQSTATATAQAGAIAHERTMETVNGITRLLVVGLVVFLVGLTAWTIAGPAMEARRRRSWIMLDTSGKPVAVFVPQYGRFMLPHELTNTWTRTTPQLQEPAPPPSAEIVEATPDYVRLVKDAAAVIDRGLVKDGEFPGYRALYDGGFDWSSDAWQKAIIPLVNAGYIRTVPSVGTFFNNDWTIAAMVAAVVNHSSLAPGRGYHPAERS